MAKTIDYVMASHSIPRWPSKCVACQAPDPTEVYRISCRFLWPLTRKFKTEIPACSDCSKSLRRSSRIVGFGSWIIPILILVAALFLIPGFKELWENLPRAVSKSLSALVIPGIIYFVWTKTKPPAIDITALKNVILYEFRDKDYAYDFKLANGGNIIG